MNSHCGRYVMIYNGELYNYQKIRKGKMEGFNWKSSGDTEVILETFARYGSECFQWFNGMFAIAIWDKKENHLTLARDHIGIKPLYYYIKDNTLVFASELKAITNAISDLLINKAVVPAFLHLGYIPHPFSIYKGVYKLEAGSFANVAINDNKVSLTEKSFWAIKNKITANVTTDEESAKKQLTALLTDSISKQLISDVPIGTFLSGGTDSSLVTAVATKVTSQKVKTFSIAVTDSKINEAPFAADVARHLRTDHHELPITQQEIMDMIPGFLSVYDEPFSDSSAFPTMLVSKLARKHVTVTLSGDGGDELFGGYNSYLWASKLQNPFLKAGAPLINAASKIMGSKYRRVGLLFQNYPKGHFNSHLFSQDQYFFSEHELSKLLVAPDFNFDSINYSFKGRKLTAFEQLSFWDMENYLKDDLLVKVDRASMQFSLETRVPLLDYRIVEFALNLDPALKIRSDGTMKYLLKQVLYDYVPKHLLDRPKWGFSIPLVKWLKTDLKWLIDKYCSKEIIEGQGFVHYSYVQKMIKDYQSGNNDHLYNRIWALIVLHWFLNDK